MSEFKELELETNDLGDEVTEEHLCSVLRNLNGVHTARITANGVHIIYNPHGVTPEEITRTVEQTGIRVDYKQPD